MIPSWKANSCQDLGASITKAFSRHSFFLRQRQHRYRNFVVSRERDAIIIFITYLDPSLLYRPKRPASRDRVGDTEVYTVP